MKRLEKEVRQSYVELHYDSEEKPDGINTRITLWLLVVQVEDLTKKFSKSLEDMCDKKQKEISLG